MRELDPAIATAPVTATIVLPAFNEAAALPNVLSSLFDVLDARHEVLVVDDGSTDETASIARKYPCRLLRHAQNRGKGAAVRTGIQAARGAFTVIMDADNTYPPGAVPRMIELAAEYDFIRGVRQYSAAQMPLTNRIGNRIFDALLKALHGLEGDDHLTGLYGLHHDVLDGMNLTSEGFDLEVEIAIKAHAMGLRTKVLPISYHERLGEKKLDAWRDGWHILHRSLTLGFRNSQMLKQLHNLRSAYHLD